MYAEKPGVHSGQQRCKTNPVLSSRTAVAGAREGAFRRLGITPWIAGGQKPPRGRDGRVQTITKGGRQTLKRKRSSAERSFASPAQADHEDPALACAIVESLRYAPATGTPISEQASSQPTESPSKRGAESDPDETSVKSDDRTEEGKCRGFELKRASRELRRSSRVTNEMDSMSWRKPLSGGMGSADLKESSWGSREMSVRFVPPLRTISRWCVRL